MALTNPYDRDSNEHATAARPDRDRLSILLQDARSVIATTRSALAVDASGGAARDGNASADALRAAFEDLSDTASALRLHALAEIAASCEAVFAALSGTAEKLTASERLFLLNVMAASNEICDRLDRHDPVTASLELIGDAFDRLLARLESA